jgi:hypothetical protein
MFLGVFEFKLANSGETPFLDKSGITVHDPALGSTRTLLRLAGVMDASRLADGDDGGEVSALGNGQSAT